MYKEKYLASLCSMFFIFNVFAKPEPSRILPVDEITNASECADAVLMEAGFFQEELDVAIEAAVANAEGAGELGVKEFFKKNKDLIKAGIATVVGVIAAGIGIHYFWLRNNSDGLGTYFEFERGKEVRRSRRIRDKKCDV